MPDDEVVSGSGRLIISPKDKRQRVWEREAAYCKAPAQNLSVFHPFGKKNDPMAFLPVIYD
jgi:hypothetical protein